MDINLIKLFCIRIELNLLKKHKFKTTLFFDAKYLKLINYFLFYKNNFRFKFLSFFLNFLLHFIFKVINVSSAFDFDDKHSLSVNGSLIIVNQQSLKKYQDFNQDEFNSRVIRAGYNFNPSNN